MNAKRIPDTSLLPGWRKSSYSGGDNGSCLEVGDGVTGLVPVRDSKTPPQGPALVVPDHGWNTFIDWTKH